MKVNFVNLSREAKLIEEELIEATKIVLKSGNYICGDNVKKFEKAWSKWLGVKYSVFVNSGSSANLISMSIIKNLFPKGEVLVPTLTWVSDIASVIQNNLKFKASSPR